MIDFFWAIQSTPAPSNPPTPAPTNFPTNNPTPAPTNPPSTANPTPAPTSTVIPTLTCGISETGSTVGLTAISMQDCGASTDGLGGAKWYKFVGTGLSTSISTCGGQTNYDTQLRVFRASDDTCVAGNDDADGCTDFQSTVEFVAEADVEYKVLVQ